MLRVRALGLTRRVLRPHTCTQSRAILSVTGEWPKEFTEEVVTDVEKYWKPKIQALDKEANQKKPDESQRSFYALSMFPYPSGNLHMGHVRTYTLSDIIARYQRTKGHHVIHPMGWDAFGLPAENAARERQRDPTQWTGENIERMRKQLDDLCLSFDYERGFATCDPEYYKWTQFLFLKLHEHGLVYQKEGLVNWDPVDQTVLADEQIDELGRSWRSGALVEKKYLKQWYIKTTAYTESLLEGLNEVNSDLWQDVVDLQREWIGDLEGVRFEFQLFNGLEAVDTHFSVFTRQPEGLYGASHILISPTHFLNQQQYYDLTEDTGSKNVIQLTLTARNFLKGNNIPIYVHHGFGFGPYSDAHIGMPCLNPLDHQFANAPHRELRYREILHKSGMIANSGKFTNMTPEEAGQGIAEMARKFKRGGHWCSEKLNDWCISRQRYWGTPIPMMHCQAKGGKAVRVPYEQLPVMLPEVTSYQGVGGKSPLATASEDWLYGFCPKAQQCGCQFSGGACCERPVRETDTMDTFVDSAWYYLRYLSPHFHDGPFDPEIATKHIPVDLYVGGKEHAVLHLFFARFFAHFLYDLGWLPSREPFRNLLSPGLVKNEVYRHPKSLAIVHRNNVDFSVKDKPRMRETGQPLISSWEKMSKSKGNGVVPEEVIDRYGVDATRLCLIFKAGPKSDLLWSETGFPDVMAIQQQIWRCVSLFREAKTQQLKESELDQEKLQKYKSTIKELRNYTVKEVNYHMNTSFLMRNAVQRLEALAKVLRKVHPGYIVHVPEHARALNDLVVIMSMFAPMYAAELRAGMGKAPSVIGEWPTVDDDYRINLKVRMSENRSYEVPMDVPLEEVEYVARDEAIAIAEQSEEFKQFTSKYQIDHMVFHAIPMYSAELFLTSREFIDDEKRRKKEAKEAANTDK